MVRVGGQKWLRLLEQLLRELLARAHGHARDVVDRLVGVQRHALATGLRQHIDHMGVQPKQAELE